MRTKKDSHKQGSPCVSSSPLQCFEPVTPAYNQSRLYSWLKLRASTYNQLWISMPAVLVTVPNATQNSLSSRAVAKTISVNSLPGIIYELSPLLLATLWILWCRKRWPTDNLSGSHPIQTIDAPTSIIPAILCRMLILLQPSKFILALDR